MALKKISDDVLLRLIREGNGSAEAARYLGVGRAAVCKRLKSLKVSSVRDVAQPFRASPASRSRALHAGGSRGVQGSHSPALFLIFWLIPSFSISPSVRAAGAFLPSSMEA